MDSQPIIHKESNQRKLKTKGLMPIDLSDYRTIGKNSTQGNETQGAIVQEVEGSLDNREQRLARTRTQLKNIEIDEFLYDLVSINIIDVKFIPFYAKACHVLGISKINQLKVNALNGDKPQNLFAYKVKGAMQLHFKREYLQGQ